MNYFVKAVYILLVCSSAQFLYAGESDKDSLHRILRHSTETERLIIYYQLGSDLYKTLPDSALYYYTEALKLARKTENDSFTAKSLNRIGIIKFDSGDYRNAIGNFFLALKLFEQQKDKQRMIRCLQYLGKAYKEQGMF